MDPHDWRARIEARLANTRPRHAMEDWLTPGLSLQESRSLQAYLPTTPIPAAVLIPVVERERQLTVLLTQRASQLKNHAGQISFPGGRIEPHDAGPSAAALREAHRVLRRGGRFYCMEFASSDWPGFSNLYEAWASKIPRIGKAVADDEDSYRYLVESIRRFPRPNAFRGMVADAGFVRAAAEPMLGGLVTIHSGWKI